MPFFQSGAAALLSGGNFQLFHRLARSTLKAQR